MPDMANRDIGISICGVVVGVMLGAGSVLYTQDAALGSVTDVAYRGGDDSISAEERNELKARYAVPRAKEQARDREVLKDARWPTPFQGDSVEETHSAAPSNSACDVAKAIAARLKIPAQQDQVYGRLRFERDSAVTDYCGSEQVEAAVEVKADYKKAAAPGKRDCSQFAPASIRYTDCMGENNGFSS